MTKVCVMTTVHPAFDGRIYHKQIQSLVKMGYEVTYVAPEPPDPAQNTLDIPIVTVPASRGAGDRIRNIFRAFKKARQQKADLYHFHDPELLLAGVMLRLTTGKPVVFDVHEHYPNAIMSKPYLKSWQKTFFRASFTLFERMALSFLSGVIYTTEDIGERYKKKHKLRLENFPLRQHFPDPPAENKEPKTLLYLGGITQIRGVIEFLEGVRLAADRHPDLNVMFVGRFERDSFKQAVFEKIEELNLESHCTFLGQVPYQELKGVIDKASIGILPYLPVPNHRVCMPNKMYEYMASGIVIAASDLPNYRREIEQAEAGVTFAPGDPQSVADQITWLLDHPEELNRMKQSGRRFFENEANWESQEEAFDAFYRQILGS
ncbi:hypothetical protein CR205_15935 [Alteribacter lacisalsi]|uniref:Glycosyltransferase WbuB n=1 Tax=Alteribacter lacisalsi TaxID=2045244 RepID=A0A2W0H4C1_9BACI|nr:glycosyltransferase family 4 protein [Alteribacter lacisalsi]PYZ95871.1 hypothetical protein CR205_15935 [Alteribacter lacisalsi]